jgi:ribosome-associated protein
MPDPIFVEGGVLVPADALEARAVRASGPGGQNVNKVASKIELKVNLERIRGMDAAARKRLLRIVARRIDSGGRLLVTSQRSRDQYRNLQDARKKVHDWIAQALRPPKKRVRTQPSEASTERRLAAKHHMSTIKQARRTVTPVDD